MQRGRARLSPASNSHDRVRAASAVFVSSVVLYCTMPISRTTPWINRSNYPHATHECRVERRSLPPVSPLCHYESDFTATKEKEREKEILINKRTRPFVPRISVIAFLGDRHLFSCK